MPLLGTAAHGGDEIGIEDVVRVEDDVCIVAEAERLQPVQQEVQNIALADMLGVVPLEYPCAALTGYFSRAVGAVVCADYDVYEMLGIVLRAAISTATRLPRLSRYEYFRCVKSPIGIYAN